MHPQSIVPAAFLRRASSRDLLPIIKYKSPSKPRALNIDFRYPRSVKRYLAPYQPPPVRWLLLLMTVRIVMDTILNRGRKPAWAREIVYKFGKQNIGIDTP